MDKAQITSAVQEAILSAFSLDDVQVSWDVPLESDHGDLSTPVALQIAKEVGKSPQEIAGILGKVLQGVDGVEKTEVAGPGYVNVWFTPATLLGALASVQEEACTQKKAKEEPPIIIDFCGPNIAKPLSAHHMGSHIIGQAIINLYKHTGCHAIGWSYPGDWGTQFGKLAVAFQRWGEKKPVSTYSVDELLALYVRFHEEAEKDPSLEDEGRAAFKKIEEGDAALREFWKEAVAVSQKELKLLYKRIHITVDQETGESFYQDKMQPIIDEGIKKKVFTEGERGALIAAFPEESGLPPAMVRKSDGSTLYITRDLAMVRYRIDEFAPQALYYVVDVAQSLHFKQIEAVCRALQWDLPTFEHTVFGRMLFKDKSMSTRKGQIIKLDHVLDEGVKRAFAVIKEHGDQVQTDDPDALAEMMGVGAVAYGILSQNRKQDIVFDWDKFLSFEGNSAPYLQYTHARTRSVLRKAAIDSTSVKIPTDLTSLSSHERALVNLLLQFPSILIEARDARMPHILANYLFLLCQTFNSFYNAEPILQSDEPQRSLRLALTSLTASVLKAGAEILTLRVPDSM